MLKNICEGIKFLMLEKSNILTSGEITVKIKAY